MTGAVLVLVAIAGGLGAASRFLVDSLIAHVNRSSVPLGTLTINVTGSLALGLITGWTLSNPGNHTWVVVLGVGFCGGFTTFSTASVEIVRLAWRGRWTLAALLTITMLVLSLGAAAAGIWALGPR